MFKLHTEDVILHRSFYNSLFHILFSRFILFSHLVAYINIYLQVSSWWTFKFFPFSASKKVSPCVHTHHSLLGSTPRTWLPSSKGCQWLSRETALIFTPSSSVWVPVVALPHKHFKSSKFLIFANLIGIKWYLVLICMFVIAGEIQYICVYWALRFFSSANCLFI